ncbi:efflux RND transporter periplasmic adaptor subunit [Hyalangium versicolor]|uniref:efflux RND transporter periplasmic adaptor subunit n=1 Tax=Hyalangium versicolor TaxID=2861190 RepID=UPI001CCA2886|nr:efflux RND transporter periplasmic adaptor subunit [Hyalangium versicolor]
MRTSFALWLCLAATACKPPPPEEKPLPQPRVRVTQVRWGPAARALHVTGVLAAPPGHDVKVGSLVPGQLTLISVAEGDRVRAGQVLGEVETGPVTDELQQAEATAKEAAAAARAAEARRARTELLVERGVAARQDAEQDRSAETAAVAAEQRARSAVELAQRKARHAELKAPFDGLVTAVFFRQGEAVDGNGQPVVQVTATDPLELRAFVTQDEAARLRAGQSAAVSVQGLPEPRTAQVVSVSPAVDAQNGNVLVRIRVPNPEGALRLSGVAQARIVTGEESPAAQVPSSALVPAEDGGLGVALVEEDKVHTVPVTVLSEEAGQAVVQGELKGGESVIVEGGYSLPEGTSVEVTR